MTSRSLRFLFSLVALAVSLPAQADSLFNLTGSEHGFGDVVGPFLLAQQASRKDRVFVLIDDRAEKVLKTVLEQPDRPLVSSREMVFVRRHDLADLPKIHRHYETFRGARRLGLTTEQVETSLREKPALTIITQDLHSPYGRPDLPAETQLSGWSEIRRGSKRLYFSAAGLGQSRLGILEDESIQPYKGKSLREQRRLAQKQFPKDSWIHRVLGGVKHPQAQLTFAYGVHNEAYDDGKWKGYPGQLASYIDGLERMARDSGRPIFVFSPNTIELIQSTLRDSSLAKILTLEQAQALSPLSTKSVYIVSTGALSAKQFVALTAASDLPYMIEGDSALSAAVRLAKPFVMLKGPWGLFGIDGLSRALSEAGATWAEKIYPIHESPGADTPNFKELSLIANDAGAFVKLSQNARSWSESLEEIASYMEGKITAEQLSHRVNDPLLSASLKSVSATTPDSAFTALLNIKSQMLRTSACRASF